jgi:hypothetical protein
MDTAQHPSKPDTPTACEVLVFEPWPDATIGNDPRSHPTASTETLLWWTPVLGPTAAMIAQRFAVLLARQPRVQISVSDLARTFGMGNSLGRAHAAIARLERFGIATCHGQSVYLRAALPPLSRRHLDQLPDYLRQLYETRRQ